ncbi:hypothetical protein [Ureibacillus chungkukjangi]|nr:hypothetical protein [Ureibacillus chungkukjangi]
MSVIKRMKDKKPRKHLKNVCHQANERRNPKQAFEKCLSSSE